MLLHVSMVREACELCNARFLFFFFFFSFLLYKFVVCVSARLCTGSLADVLLNARHDGRVENF